MGLEQSVEFRNGVPQWPEVQRLLAERGLSVQMRMIDGELAFPDELPGESWRELRVGGDAGMVTIRRAADLVVLVTWGNAEAPLLEMRDVLARAFAEAGDGRI